MWFWIGYISIGLWILMPGIIHVWQTDPQPAIIKLFASILAVAIWPVALLELK